jgi:competence ComEA-like helix-hairpin-helix protein
MNKFFKEYFSFTRGERSGILILLLIIILLFSANQYAYLFVGKKNTDISEFSESVRQFENSLKPKFQAYEQKDTNFQKTDSTKLFYFDPNTITSEQWKELGLSEKLIHTINNYLSKGGHFYKKEDLKKIYNFPAEKYILLEPYIQIKNAKVKAEKSNQIKEENTLQIEINSADTTELIKLKGIGPVFAKRIIKYRELLGGFVNTEQLKEVYGLNEQLFNQINSFIHADPSKIKKINLNTASFKEINKHPYISYEQTKKIVLYRSKKGKLLNINELKENDLLPADIYEKVSKYLSVE